jgi:hypothetical protein
MRVEGSEVGEWCVCIRGWWCVAAGGVGPSIHTIHLQSKPARTHIDAGGGARLGLLDLHHVPARHALAPALRLAPLAALPCARGWNGWNGWNGLLLRVSGFWGGAKSLRCCHHCYRLTFHRHGRGWWWLGVLGLPWPVGVLLCVEEVGLRSVVQRRSFPIPADSFGPVPRHRPRSA